MGSDAKHRAKPFVFLALFHIQANPNPKNHCKISTNPCIAELTASPAPSPFASSFAFAAAFGLRRPSASQPFSQASSFDRNGGGTALGVEYSFVIAQQSGQHYCDCCCISCCYYNCARGSAACRQFRRPGSNRTLHSIAAALRLRRQRSSGVAFLINGITAPAPKTLRDCSVVAAA